MLAGRPFMRLTDHINTRTASTNRPGNAGARRVVSIMVIARVRATGTRDARAGERDIARACFIEIVQWQCVYGECGRPGTRGGRYGERHQEVMVCFKKADPLMWKFGLIANLNAGADRFKSSDNHRRLG